MGLSLPLSSITILWLDDLNTGWDCLGHNVLWAHVTPAARVMQGDCERTKVVLHLIPSVNLPFFFFFFWKGFCYNIQIVFKYGRRCRGQTVATHVNLNVTFNNYRTIGSFETKIEDNPTIPHFRSNPTPVCCRTHDTTESSGAISWCQAIWGNFLWRHSNTKLSHSRLAHSSNAMDLDHWVSCAMCCLWPLIGKR